VRIRQSSRAFTAVSAGYGFLLIGFSSLLVHALASGGESVVVGEDLLAPANRLAVDATVIDVDQTGSAGHAGLVALRERGEVGDDERAAVLFTGRRRSS
jgi:hypothetical protein